MAGGGSHEMRKLQGSIEDVGVEAEAALKSCTELWDVVRELKLQVSDLQLEIRDLQRQVAGLQAALRGGDVGPASPAGAGVGQVQERKIGKRGAK